MLVGYMRVSSADERQSLDLQRDALLTAGLMSDISMPIGLRVRATIDPGLLRASGSSGLATAWRCGGSIGSDDPCHTFFPS
jgi:hypothetical protein